MLQRIAGVVCLVAWASAAGAQDRYYPDRFDWARRTPAEAGMSRTERAFRSGPSPSSATEGSSVGDAGRPPG